MDLNYETYRSPESEMAYMTASQFKDFLRCEARALARVLGDYNPPPSEAMLIGSYFDALAEGRGDEFLKEHPEATYKGKTEPKKAFKHAELMYERAFADPIWAHYATGAERQKIVKGHIAGVAYKGMIDVVGLDFLADIKTTRTFDKVWSDERQTYTSFAGAYNYDIQGTIYQGLYLQETGERLPFFLAAVTKEDVPDYEVFSIPQHDLDDAIDIVYDLSPRYARIKEGALEPRHCGKCEFCRQNKRIKQPKDWKEYRA